MKNLIFRMIRIGLLVSVVTALLFGEHPNHLHAQTADITGSGLNTSIHSGGMTTFIDGGTRPAGGPNLFHSFGNFSVGEGHTALFRNSDGGATSNILGRVTGGNISNIFGTIDSVTNFPQANLWLINPAGFLFGRTASLNVGGAVNISTGDYLKMTDGNTFFADPSKNSVLSMDPVSAFGFLGANPGGTISIQGGTVNHASTLTLVGRDLSDSGGDMVRPGITLTAGTLSTSGAGVNLISVKTPHNPDIGGEIAIGDLSPTPGQDISVWGTVQFDSGGTLKTTATTGNAGPIFIRTHDFIMDHGGIDARTLEEGSSQPSLKRGGDIDIHASNVRLTNGAIAGPFHKGSGTEGEIYLFASAKDTGGTIVTNNTGNIVIRGMDIFLNNALLRSHNMERPGQTAIGLGDIRIQGNNGPDSLAHHVVITDSQIHSVGEDPITLAASGGSISIAAESIVLGPHSTILNIMGNGISLHGKDSISSFGQDNHIVSGSVGRYSAGSISLRSDVQVSLAEPRDPNEVFLGNDLLILSAPLASAINHSVDVPSISIKAPTINLLNAGLSNEGRPPTSSGPINLFGNRIIIDNTTLTSSSLGGGSRAGDIEIAGFRAESRAQKIEVNESFILSLVNPLDPKDAVGRSGNVHLNGEVITVDRSEISVIHAGQGESGSIIMDSGQFRMRNSGLVSITFANDVPPGNSSAGAKAAPGGNVEINARGTIDISRSGIQASTVGDGKAGDITLTSRGTMNVREATIDSSSGNVEIASGYIFDISANTFRGNAGNITLSSGSNINLNATGLTTSALKTSGGNIKLTAPNVISLVNSTLSSSVQGQVGSNGGNISIDPIAVAIQNSQISATASDGAGGTINIIASGAVLVDPNSKLDATAGPAGISGRVNINAPIQVLGGTLVPLKVAYSQPVLSGDRCAADLQGKFSSFVHTGREGVPLIPGAFTPSPLFVLDRLLSSSRGMQLPNLTAARLGLERCRSNSNPLVDHR